MEPSMGGLIVTVTIIAAIVAIQIFEQHHYE
jgi:hypothetical protein